MFSHSLNQHLLSHAELSAPNLRSGEKPTSHFSGLSCLLVLSPLLPLHLWTVQETEEDSFSGPCSAVSCGPSLLIHIGVGVLGSLLTIRLGNTLWGRLETHQSLFLLQAHLHVHPSMHSSEVGIKGLVPPMGCGEHWPRSVQLNFLPRWRHFMPAPSTMSLSGSRT